MKLTFWIILLFSLAACHPNAYKELKQSTSGSETFGAVIKENKAVSLAEVRDQLETKDTLFVTSVGDVSEVCQKKGCWMVISPKEDTEPMFMVKFKDYGFFVPKDIAGETVVLHGKAFRQITSVGALRHYAQDAGKSQAEIDAITEPEEEYIFIADGVELFREKI